REFYRRGPVRQCHRGVNALDSGQLCRFSPEATAYCLNQACVNLRAQGGRRLSWRTTAKSIINGSLRPFGVKLQALPSATQVDDYKRLTRRTVKEYLALCDPKVLFDYIFSQQGI